ncbi:MAG TPA: DUF4845 domain-containing protein [Gammaproteobacteria bacterium]|nr:DUF4845 domain-containing protein [Gammaproteobacteria bacterium]
MHTKTSQRGMSLISMLLVAVIAVVVMLLVIRLFPVYYDSYVVSSIFSEVSNDARGKTSDEIRDTIERRFEVNEVNMISIREVKITPVRGGGSDVSLHYEQRVPFIGNLGLIATFDKHVLVPGS